MSTVGEAVAQGRPVEALFIDAHGHFGPWPDTVIPYCLDRGRVIAEMDRYGCDMVWMSASNPGYADDLSVKNDYVFDFAAEHPDRIIPYCTLTANRPDRNVGELKRCLGRGRCIGVKMHRYEQPPYTMKSDFLRPVLEILQEHRLVYMNHGYADLGALRWALEAYPDLVFISGHMSAPINDLAAEFANLRDCTCAAMHYGEVGEEVRRLGRSDTMLLGSDFALMELGFGLGMVAYADIPEQDKLNILGRNALELLRRVSWFGEVRFTKPIT
jgi:predicted TIM-barrel fold metal-dependent hydrolase